MSDALDYDQWIHLDAEALAEAGIGEAYESLRAALQKYVREPAAIAEVTDNDAPRYTIKYGGREFVVYSPELDDEAGNSWGRATYAFFAIVNDQLATTAVRFYAINGGNDLGGMFLTPAQANAAQGKLRNKRDWPYLPTDMHPFYGQYQ